MSEWKSSTIDSVVTLLRRGTAPVYVDSSAVIAIGQRCVRNEGFDVSPTRSHMESAPVVVAPVAGDVLLNSTGTGTIGRSCVFPSTSGRFMIDGHVTVLRGDSELVDGRILNALLQSPIGQRLLETRCFTGSTNQVELSRSELAKLEFSLPPLEEQRRIAEILDTIDETIQATERVIAKHIVRRTGIRQNLLGTHVNRNEHTTFGEQFAMILGKMMSPASLTGQNPSPFLANRNVQWERFVLDDLDSMDFSFPERQKYRIIAGDLLVCEGGEVGRAAVWTGPSSDVYFQKAIHRLRPKGDIGSEYAMHYLKHASETGVFAKFTTQTSIAHLTGEQLAKMPLPITSGMDQGYLVRQMNNLKLSVDLELRTLAKLQGTRAGLAADLLSGRVRTVAP